MWTGRRAMLTLALSAGAALLASCGGAGGGGVSNPLEPVPKGTSADLRGGWLVAGVMPFGAPLGSTGPAFGLALNLDIVDGQVTGFGSTEIPCGTPGGLVGEVGGDLRLASAAIAADGSFTLTDVLLGNNTQHQVVVQGTVPATAGGAWSGTYTVGAPNARCNGVVPPTQTGSFTAQRIADLDGSFVGSGTLNNTSAAVSFTAAVTQGGPTSLDSLTTRLNDQSVLQGTLAVEGISCFKSGAVDTTGGFPRASLIGNQAQLQFVMDDGSTVFLQGWESDTSATTLQFVTLLVRGGACDKTFVGITTATKQ